MICVCAYKARIIRVTVIIETRGFYKEKRGFIYSLDNVEILLKKTNWNSSNYFTILLGDS